MVVINYAVRMTRILTVGPILLALLAWSCTQRRGPGFRYEGEKMKGVAFVAPRDSLVDSTYLPVKRVNAEWVALMPYGFVREGSAEFVYGKDNDWKWWGESPRGAAHCVEMAHRQGLKVMLKPHMWAGRGTFTGHFDLASEAEWRLFERSYGAYLLDFARLADSTGVELYCIGTEMQTFVKKRPQFWFGIIRDIKRIYKGQLTYAENWDVFEEVPFWNELDYIGIDAYFPLSDEPSPGAEAIKSGWQPHLKAMRRLAAKVQRPILFTEFGYMSTDYAARRPWETDRDRAPNQAVQAEAYRVLFEHVWREEWMAGGFVWKWFPKLPPGQWARDPFSPQNKLAEGVLQKYFAE